MVTAERLTFITEVHDRFSSDLSKLTALLETADEQAEDLSPVVIPVQTPGLGRLRELNQQLRRASRRQQQVAAQSALTATPTAEGDLNQGVRDLLDDVKDATETTANTVSDSDGLSLAERLKRNQEQIKSGLSDIDTRNDEPVEIADTGGQSALGQLLDQVADGSFRPNRGGGGGGGGGRGGGGGGTNDDAGFFDTFTRLRDLGAQEDRESLLPDAIAQQVRKVINDDAGEGVALGRTVFRDAIPTAPSEAAGETPVETRVALEQLLRDRRGARALPDFDEFLENIGIDSNAQLQTPSGESIESLADFVTLDNRAIEKTFDGAIEDVDDLLREATSQLDMDQFRRRSMFDTLSNLRVGMTRFYDLLAAVLPLLGLFVGTIPAVVGGLVGLAGAAVAAAGTLGAIGGLGLLGASIQEAGGDVPGFSDVSDVFDGIGEDFVAAFRPVATDLAPLFRDGVDALSRLFDRLGQTARGLTALTDEARAFGRFVEEALVAGFNDMIRLAEATAPLFARIGNALSDIDVAEALAGTLADMLPLLSFFTVLLTEAIPDLLSFSRGLGDVASVVGQVLGRFIEFLSLLVSFGGLLGNGDRMLGRLIGSLLTLSTTLLIASKVTAIYATLQNLAAKNTRAAAAAQFLLNTATAIYTKIAGVLTAILPAKAAALASVAAAAATAAIAVTALAVAASFLTAGLSAVLGGIGLLGGGAAGAADDVDNLTGSLRELERQQDRLAGGGGPFMGDLDRSVYVTVNDTTNMSVEGDLSASQYEEERVSDVNSFSSQTRETDTYF